MRVRYLRVFGGLPLLVPAGVIGSGHLAQGTGNVVVIGRDDLHPLWADRQGGRN